MSHAQFKVGKREVIRHSFTH